MSREDDFKTRMTADATLMAILTGGVHTKAETGREGITRETVPSAFDAATGYLKPCALVRQRALIPDGRVFDELEAIASAVQVIEIYVYQDSGYSSIDPALARQYTLLQGYQFSDSAPAQWVYTSGREQDLGPLAGASLVRQDWAVAEVIGD